MQPRIRLGAVALCLWALLFLAFQLFHPVSSLDLERDPDGAARTFGSADFVLTDSLLILAFTFLSLGILAVQTRVTDSWGFAGMVLILAALGPFQAFTSVGAFGFSAASQVYLQGNQEALKVLAAMINGPSVHFGLLGVLMLTIRSIAMAVGIWRSGTLPKWAGVMFALGLSLFIVAVSSPASVQKMLRLVDGILGGVGALWLAWSLWHK